MHHTDARGAAGLHRVAQEPDTTCPHVAGNQYTGVVGVGSHGDGLAAW